MQFTHTEKAKASKKTLPSKQPRSRRVANVTEPPHTSNSTASLIEAPPARTTKQELVLTLLSRKEGASIEDIMEVTRWQVHSVRGFLAGTVKKKLGYNLTSSKSNGEERRYRILPRKLR